MSTIISESTILHWLWLQNIDGQGGPLAEQLLPLYRYNIDQIFAADEEELETIHGLSDEQRERLADKDLSEAMKIRAVCRNEGIRIITPDQVSYPPGLRQIRRPPLALYLIGELPDTAKTFCVATVGTRKMTDYGSKIGYVLAYDLACAGTVIVSGMAKGLDGIAHRACLDAGGKTVAVLGCGVNVCYPKEHQQLRDEILARGGGVVSEYPPFTPPIGTNFPIRNRIISGMCPATLIVEAGEKSGALITARSALYQGRRLFALPGKIDDEAGAGVNQLLQQGAELATCAIDILRHFTDDYPSICLGATPVTGIRSKTHKSPIKRKAKLGDRTYVDYDTAAQRPNASPAPEPLPIAAFPDLSEFAPLPAIPKLSKIPEPSEIPDLPELPEPSEIPELSEIPVLSEIPAYSDSGAAPAPRSASSKPEAPSASEAPSAPAPMPPLSEEERAVYELIPPSGSISIDLLTAKLTAEHPAIASQLLITLVSLEIKGLIGALPGSCYGRV